MGLNQYVSLMVIWPLENTKIFVNNSKAWLPSLSFQSTSNFMDCNLMRCCNVEKNRIDRAF